MGSLRKERRNHETGNQSSLVLTKICPAGQSRLRREKRVKIRRSSDFHGRKKPEMITKPTIHGTPKT